eukprot:gene11596-biopygen6376
MHRERGTVWSPSKITAGKLACAGGRGSDGLLQIQPPTRGARHAARRRENGRLSTTTRDGVGTAEANMHRNSTQTSQRPPAVAIPNQTPEHVANAAARNAVGPNPKASLVLAADDRATCAAEPAPDTKTATAVPMASLAAGHIANPASAANGRASPAARAGPVHFPVPWGSDPASRTTAHVPPHQATCSTPIGAVVVGEAVVGEAVVGEAVVGEAVVGEAEVGEAVVGKAVVGEAVLGEAVVDETVVGVAVVGEAVDGEAGAGEVVNGEAVVGEAVVGEAVVGTAVVGEAEVGEAVVGEAVVGEAVVGEAVVGETVDGEAVIGEAVVGRRCGGQSC